MFHVNDKSGMMKSALLLLMFTSAFSFMSKAGQDFYEIYLNKKLILKQAVNQASPALANLPLDDAKESDQISIYYYHCDVKGAGKGRTIVVRNERNEILKEWKFDDPTSTDGVMNIPVKDILALKKKYAGAGLQLYYTSSQQLPKGMVLASITPAGKKVAGLKKSAIPVLSTGLLGFIMLIPALKFS